MQVTRSKMTLKTQYKTAGKFYVVGAGLIGLAHLKYKNGQYVFLPKGRKNLMNVGGSIYVIGYALHLSGNARVVGRAAKWIAKKVFK